MSQRRDPYKLDVPATAAAPAGQVQNVADLQDKWIQVSATFTGAANIEGRIIPNDWRPLITGVVIGFAAIPQGVLEVRVKRTADGSGEIYLSGLARSAS